MQGDVLEISAGTGRNLGCATACFHHQPCLPSDSFALSGLQQIIQVWVHLRMCRYYNWKALTSLTVTDSSRHMLFYAR